MCILFVLDYRGADLRLITVFQVRAAGLLYWTLRLLSGGVV